MEPGRVHGSVVAFDADRGWGELQLDDGRRLGFHCVAIADGSRTIEVGARVSASVVPKLGRWEADRLVPG